jgi:hypothetical protein
MWHANSFTNCTSLKDIKFWVGKVVPCDVLIHPAFLSPFKTPKTICKSILNLREVPQEMFSNIQTNKCKHLPNLTNKSFKNNQAFYFIFQKYLKTFIVISILFCIILYYFVCCIIWVAYQGQWNCRQSGMWHVWGGREEKSIQLFGLDS